MIKEKYYVKFFVKKGNDYQSYYYYDTPELAEEYALSQKKRYKNLFRNHEIQTLEVNNHDGREEICVEGL